ncbi:MAG: hypothetical protein ABI867_18745 [Kofleriaceae bacterium]
MRFASLVVLVACSGPSKPTVVPAPGPGSEVQPVPVVAGVATPVAAPSKPDAQVIAAAKAALGKKHGDAAKPRIELGVDQVASLWRAEDGDLVAFVTEQFVSDPKLVDALFARLEAQLEQVDGHVLELGRSLRWDIDVDTGPQLPVDSLLGAYDPGAHVVEDLFASKAAFAAVLNFPLTTLDDRLRDATKYTRRQWAEVRLTGRFNARIPGTIAAQISAAGAAADEYIAGYNLWMHHVLGEAGERRFPSGKRLITHWNLRDELKANYADKDGPAKQRTIVMVMERIVSQTIPKAVIDNPRLDWNPFTNAVTAAPAAEIEANAPAERATTPSQEKEPDARFTRVLAHFAAYRKADPFSPTAPTHLARAFDKAEMPEPRVRRLLLDILESPLIAQAAKEIETKLGRKLEPQDIWYEFGGGEVPEAQLDAETRKRYPTPQAFAKDLPRIFRDLGFTDKQGKTFAANIAVDPSRGAGHAMEARRHGDKPHLRTRVGDKGMDYKGYNIAVHELGHNVEQYLSLYEVDHTLLAGVPNTAFTEALAFLFQARDLKLLGRPSAGAEAERLRVLDHLWNTWEIAGSSLVEIDVWHWLYDHPNATAAELRDATNRIARETWDKYYAPVLGGKGTKALLGIYSHTITSPLYLFNYVLGHMIAFQMEEHVAGKDAKTFASEFTRIAKFGAVLPDEWMKHATGAAVSAKPMLDAAARAVKK